MKYLPLFLLLLLTGCNETEGYAGNVKCFQNGIKIVDEDVLRDHVFDVFIYYNKDGNLLYFPTNICISSFNENKVVTFKEWSVK